jgi:hypothetical protein
MKRAHTFFLVDAVAFVLFALLTSTGVLVRYVLPPGSGRWSTLWGMDRHEWGSVHFWMAVALLGTLALHLFFHWKWVVSMVTGRPREGSGARLGLAIVGILALLALASAPLLSPVERTSAAGEHAGGSHEEAGEGAAEHVIRGSMTLGEVEALTGVPMAVIVSELGLPEDTAPDEKLGQLRRAHGFEMSRVRAIVAAHQGD